MKILATVVLVPLLAAAIGWLFARNTAHPETETNATTEEL